MKIKIATIIVTALLTTTAFAQDGSSAVELAPVQPDISSQGIRISVIKPTFDLTQKATAFGKSSSRTDKIQESIGFSLGYAYLPVQQAGATINLSYIEMKGDTLSRETAAMVRFDGNLAYAFNEYFNVKGGLNISKFTKPDLLAEEFNLGVGFQASLGIQFTQNFGLDIGYAQMNQSAEDKSGILKVEAKEAGLEVGLNGTF